jgi:hypothetical protein
MKKIYEHCYYIDRTHDQFLPCIKSIWHGHCIKLFLVLKVDRQTDRQTDRDYWGEYVTFEISLLMVKWPAVPLCMR